MNVWIVACRAYINRAHTIASQDIIVMIVGTKLIYGILMGNIYV